MIKVIYFDFFKVICDPIYTPIILKYLAEKDQKEMINKLDVLDIGDMSEDEFVQEISARSGVQPEQILTDANKFAALNTELLTIIKENLKPSYKIGLLTNAHETLINRIFSEYFSLFDILLISSKLHLIKPNKEIFEVAIKEAGVNSDEILFVDDSERNVDMAKSIGIQTILFTDNESFRNKLNLIISS